MPGKVHVKGKRKAPLPPSPIKHVSSHINEAEKAAATVQTTPCESKILNTDAILLTANGVNAKKKFAPQPPVQRPTNGNTNNLSSAAVKVTEKNNVPPTLFNIVEPNQNRFSAKTASVASDEPVLTKFSYKNTNDGIAHELNIDKCCNGTENTQVWNCQYCTLENPFWKIVCAACDRIKPYGTPTHIPNGLLPKEVNNINDEATTSNGDAHTDVVKMRSKSSKAQNNAESQSRRCSLDISIQPYAEGPLDALKESDNNASKRSSMIVDASNNNFTMNTLEMEKQRLRAVIRSMNKRAFAEKYSHEKVSKDEIVINRNTDVEHKYETIKKDNLNDLNSSKNIAKVSDGKKKKNKESTSTQTNTGMKLVAESNSKSKKNDKRLNDAKQQVIDAKTQTTGTQYDFVGNLATFCDQTRLSGTMTKLEAEIASERLAPAKSEADKVKVENNLQ